MDKINFKNYEDEQTTPINAQALNAIQDNVESAINLKASKVELEEAISNIDVSEKADITYVDSELELKADIATTYTKTETDNSLGLKADTTYVNTELAKKEDKSEIVTNANGTAIKYDNGTMICYHSWKVVNTAIATARGNVFGSAEIIPPNFPVNFIAIPETTYTMKSQDVSGTRLFWISVGALQGGPTIPPTFFIGSSTNTNAYANAGYWLSYIAIGKWK